MSSVKRLYFVIQIFLSCSKPIAEAFGHATDPLRVRDSLHTSEVSKTNLQNNYNLYFKIYQSENKTILTFITVQDTYKVHLSK